MRKLWRKRWFRVTTYVIAALLLAGVAFCGYFGIYGPNDVVAYYCMRLECHPVWKDLALRRVRKGDPVEKLVRLHAPSAAERRGPYTVFHYYRGGPPTELELPFTGVTAIARDGRVVTAEAWSCTWQHTFFGNSVAVWTECSTFPFERLR